MGLPAEKIDDDKIHRFTYADYLNWPEDERWELIDGIAYNMSPVPNRKHQRISVGLCGEIYAYLKDKPCEVYDAPFDVCFPKGITEDAAVDTVVQPDLVVICDEQKLTDRGCTGAPDLVIEILSPRTALKDKREKYQLYQNNGVREYWLVHPEELWVEVFELRDTGLFERKGIYAPEDTVEVGIFPGFTIDLQSIFGVTPKEPEKQPGSSRANTENSEHRL